MGTGVNPERESKTLSLELGVDASADAHIFHRGIPDMHNMMTVT